MNVNKIIYEVIGLYVNMNQKGVEENEGYTNRGTEGIKKLF